MSRPCEILTKESVFAGSIIPLRIGTAICPTYLHYRLLCARSPHFARLLADWSGRIDDTVALADAEPDVFEQFSAWLYTDCIAVRRRKGAWLGLCKVWVLGEKFEVPALQNKVVETIACRLYEQDLASLSLEVLAYVYDKTEPQSLLRKLFVHICIYYGNADGFAELTKELPPNFHTDYALQRAWRARVEGAGAKADEGWDLTRFLLEERRIVVEEKLPNSPEPVKVKQERRDSVTEERVQCATQ